MGIFKGKSKVFAVTPPAAKSPHRDSVQSDTSSKLALRKEITLMGAVGIVVCEVIGSGIFLSAQEVLESSGSPMLALGIWIVGGILALLGALSYAELAMMMPQSGGNYVYIEKAFGEFTAFLSLWSVVVAAFPTTLAITAMLCADYVLYPFYGDCPIPDAARQMCATCIILLICVTNCVSIPVVQKIVKATTVGKFLALGSVILLGGVYTFGMGHISNLSWSRLSANTNWDVSKISVAFFQVFFACTGFQNLNFVVGEVKNPSRNVPLALIIGVPLISVIYLAVNLSYYAVLDVPEMIKSPILTLSFLTKFMGTMSIWPRVLVAGFIVYSCIGTLTSKLLTQSRLFFVSAQRGQLPEVLGMINEQTKTPMPSVILLTLLVISMVLSAGYKFLLVYNSFISTIVAVMAVLAQLRLRYIGFAPDAPKYHIGLPIANFVLLLYFLLTPIFARPVEVIVSLVIFVSGGPVYWVFVKQRSRLGWLLDWPSALMTHFVQKVLFCRAQDDLHVD